MFFLFLLCFQNFRKHLNILEWNWKYLKSLKICSPATHPTFKPIFEESWSARLRCDVCHYIKVLKQKLWMTTKKEMWKFEKSEGKIWFSVQSLREVCGEALLVRILLVHCRFKLSPQPKINQIFQSSQKQSVTFRFRNFSVSKLFQFLNSIGFSIEKIWYKEYQIRYQKNVV